MIKTTLDGKSTVSVSRSSTASPLLESLTYALIVTLDVELFAWHSFSIRPMPSLAWLCLLLQALFASTYSTMYCSYLNSGQPPFHPHHPPIISVEFNVNGQGTTLYGDGFAMWYTNGIQQLGDVFGSTDSFRGLGVFFDTVSSSPYVPPHAGIHACPPLDSGRSKVALLWR